MKSLDEIIKALSIPAVNGYHYIDSNDAIDALKYLEMYKELANDSALFAKWKENPPLTWNELRTMDGKPVWATFDNENGTWYITKVYDDEVVLYEWGQEFGERISGTWDYTPERWQAYRKERKDDTG